jgi:PKD repeat protein
VTASDSVSVFGVTATESTSGGAAPLSVTFTATAAGGTSPYSYNWNFGDGNSSASQNPSHQYTCPGSFQPSLTVTDAGGHSSTVSLTAISVTGNCGSGTLVTVKATGTPLTGSVPLTCDFTGSASGGTAPYTFAWNYGDGGTGTGQSVTHTYYSTGTFTVGLNVTDSAGHHAAPYTLTVTVNPAPTTGHLAVAIAASPSNGSAPLAVTFAAAVSGGSGSYTSFTWNFGDTGTGAGQYITHTYATARNQPYTVELTVTDSAGNVGHQYANITVTAGSSNQQSSPGGTPWWFWLMVLVVVILAVVIVAMVVRGRKAKANSYPGPYDTSTAPTEFPPGNFQTYPPGPGAPPPHQ